MAQGGSELTSRNTSKPARLLTFWSGGWVLLAAAIMCVLAAVWMLGQRRHLVGDGVHVETYGFDLSYRVNSPGELSAGGLSKDGLKALTNPEFISADEAAQRRYGHSRFLLDAERVVGVEIGGEARAYPVAILSLHEVVNDTLGGRPIVVSYSGLCDSVVVAGREVGGRVLEFGVSGLLFNSNLVMYDRRPGGKGESLWSQLQWRAIAGPAAREGAVLELVPCAVMRWDEWRALHPKTGVIVGDPALVAEYPRNRYSVYLSTDEVKFPVTPLWQGELPKKTPVAAVKVADGWKVVVLPRLRELDAAGRAAALAQAGIQGRYDEAAGTLVAEGEVVVPCFLFAWYGLHPGEMALVP